MDPIESAINQIHACSTRFLVTFRAVPDDKLDWSPAEGAKTSREIMRHMITSHYAMAQTFTGTPLIEDMAAWEAAHEADFADRAALEKLFEEATEKVCAQLRNVDPATLSELTGPPHMQLPRAFWINLPARHADMHGGQIDYLQTCWGDQEFHFR